ncbi:unnamed protein product [Meganyctiphanes norvegica]|uniref:Bestrophin homolog n=1 Tax=Meganyctiphanes norvegica TaxID=48144 RepID=A0AAV2Q0M0_MEGNR
MTISYRDDVITSNKIGFGFLKLLFRLKGSIYRLLVFDLIVFIILYTLISIIHRVALYDEYLIAFENWILYFRTFTDKLPLGFVLGFYCSIVYGRWWAQYQSIPWPDTLCMNVSINLKGQDDDARMMRRNIVRYANLAINIAFTGMARHVKDRFKTLDKFVDEGFLTPNEKILLENFAEETKNTKSTNHKDGGPLPNFWIPLLWASSIVTKARAEGKISTDLGCKAILGDLTSLRSTCGGMLSFAWINVPLVYTQVVTIAVYSFFLTTLIGSQYSQLGGFDFYVPLLTLLQFIFYMGWLKTAETLLNPFGDDEDDFEIDYLIDRNHEMGYVIVDKLHSGHPELCQDIHWASILPSNNEATIMEIEDVPKQKTDEYMQLQEPANDDGGV